MNIFARLAAGDSAAWTDVPFTDTNGNTYSAAAYALTYEIRGAATLTLNAVAAGANWKTSMSTTQSLSLTPGDYSWSAYATAAGVRVTAGTGRFTITDNLAAAVAGYDGRSQNEKDLATVRLALTARRAGDYVTEYMIGNRSLKKETLAQLILDEAALVRKVRREREAEMMANGQGNPRRVRVRFGN